MLKTEEARSRKQRRTLKQIHEDLKELRFEGSYDWVAAFARTWREGQIDRINSTRKRTRQASIGAAVAQDVIDEVLGHADAVVAAMYGLLPPGFPADLADAILQGMSRQAWWLRDMPDGEAGADAV